MQIRWTSGSQMPAIFKHRTNGVKVSSVKFAFVLISVIVNMHCSFVQHKSSVGILPPSVRTGTRGLANRKLWCCGMRSLGLGYHQGLVLKDWFTRNEVERS